MAGDAGGWRIRAGVSVENGDFAREAMLISLIQKGIVGLMLDEDGWHRPEGEGMADGRRAVTIA